MRSSAMRQIVICLEYAYSRGGDTSNSRKMVIKVLVENTAISDDFQIDEMITIINRTELARG